MPKWTFEWRPITASNDPRFFNRGTVLGCAPVPGTLSRLMVYEVRTVTRNDLGESEYDREFLIRDAAKLSDADVRDGKQAPSVGHFATQDDLESALDQAKAKHPEEFSRYTIK